MKTVYGADPASPMLTPITPVGTDGVMLLLKLHEGGLSIDLLLEGDSPETPKLINMKDPAHVLAWYVQNNALQIMPQAALALMTAVKHESGRHDLDLADEGSAV